MRAVTTGTTPAETMQMDSRNKCRVFSNYAATCHRINPGALRWPPLLALLILSGIATPVLAQTCGGGICETDGDASAWRLENYVTDTLHMWYVDPVNCGTNGGILFDAAAVDADRNRLVAIIATAKASGLQVFLRYYISGGNCYFSSFGFKP